MVLFSCRPILGLNRFSSVGLTRLGIAEDDGGGAAGNLNSGMGIGELRGDRRGDLRGAPELGV